VSRLIVIHAFDAHAGAQRVAATLATGLRMRGQRVSLWLGFGVTGFVSEAGPTWRFAPLERVSARKLLYPIWLVVASCAMLFQLPGRNRVWANSIHAFPVAWPFLLFAPGRLILHVHENNPAPPFMWLIRFAVRRGTRVVSVSRYHATRLGVQTRVLRNAVHAAEGQPRLPAPALLFVGTAQPAKGFALFLEIVRCLAGSGLEPIACLAGGALAPPPSVTEAAAAAGIRVVIGETDTARIYAGGWLTLQLTDPALADETFSLVAAESVWHLVPVGAAGAVVVDEVAEGAVAFNIASRNPEDIADAIRALQADPVRHAALVQGCTQRREDFRLGRFLDGAEAILRETATAYAHG
jgi:glycosyltransferase involved in cell wall biosynthesis